MYVFDGWNVAPQELYFTIYEEEDGTFHATTFCHTCDGMYANLRWIHGEHCTRCARDCRLCDRRAAAWWEALPKFHASILN